MQQHWKPKILTIWLGQSVSLLSSSVLQMAIIWHLSARTGSASVLTIATLCGFVPQAILGMFTGVFVDRYPRKIIIMLSDSCIALTSLFMAVASWHHDLPIWVIMVMLVLRSIGTALQEPAVHALTPMLVPQAHITQYAGYSQAFDSVSMLLSPALAALLYDALGLHYIMLFDVLGAAFAVLLFAPISMPAQEVSQSLTKQVHIISETRAGWAILKEYQVVPLVLIGALYTMIFFPIGSLYPHITLVYFGATTGQAGAVETIFSVGALIGSLILGRMGASISKFHALYCSMLVYGTGVFITGMLPPNGLFVFMALSLVIGVSVPFYHGITAAVYQCRVPEPYLGRAFSVAMSIRRLAMPVGALISGVFADTVGVNVLFAVMGVLSVVLGLCVRTQTHIRACCDC